MKIRSNFIPLLFLAVFLYACVQPPNYSDVPEITFERLNQDSIIQGNGVIQGSQDTLEVIFSFTDGNGDIGADNDSIDVFFQDSRDETVIPFKLPFIPDQGLGNGISGEVTVRIPNQPFNICCTFPDGSPPCLPNATYPVDTFSYKIFIKDRSGNESNRIQSDQITILCQ